MRNAILREWKLVFRTSTASKFVKYCRFNSRSSQTANFWQCTTWNGNSRMIIAYHWWLEVTRLACLSAWAGDWRLCRKATLAEISYRTNREPKPGTISHLITYFESNRIAKSNAKKISTTRRKFKSKLELKLCGP